MRVAMLSCNTGEGHNSAARSIEKVLNEYDVQCELLDVLSCMSPRFSKFLCDWHARLYKYAPKLWDVGYRVVENQEHKLGDKKTITERFSFGAKKLKAWLDEGNFDGIICTHVFASMMITELRKKGEVDLPCFFVGTDYTRYPYVERCDMDGFMIPSEDLLEEHVASGIAREKIIPSGIPVRQEFYEKGDKQTAREALGLPADRTILLLMGGSMGCGPIAKMAKQLKARLPEGCMVVAICAKNKKLLETLTAISDDRLQAVGFTKQVADYMEASDMILTKPGGLSCTESANKGLPMIFINSVGGCENYNFDFFMERGYAVGSADPEEVLDLAVELAGDPERRNKMSEGLEGKFTVNSSRLIAQTALEAIRKHQQKSAV